MTAAVEEVPVEAPESQEVVSAQQYAEVVARMQAMETEMRMALDEMNRRQQDVVGARSRLAEAQAHIERLANILVERDEEIASLKAQLEKKLRR